MPGAFSLSDDGAVEAFCEDTEGIVVQKLHCESMSAKLAISKVCQQWRHLILPWLFEYVLIRSNSHAKTVGRYLRRLRSTQQSSEFYGRWIRSPAFGVWIGRQEEAVERVLAGARAGAPQ